MADNVTPETRSRMMARIRAKDTGLEMLIRKGLHAQGLRFRLHSRDLPGTPDLAFRKYGAVIFINGCFWHGHNCTLFRLPGTRTEFWSSKIRKNRSRDLTAMAALQEMGWRILTVWECAVRGKGKRSAEEVITECALWLRGNDHIGDIRGNDEQLSTESDKIDKS